MKHKLSISIEEDIVKQIEQKVGERLFRNKSHIIEYALFEFFKKKELVK